MKLKKVFSIILMLLIVFMVGCKKTDDNALTPFVVNPTVNSTDPVNNATGVAINRMIVVTFSEPMDQATINSLTFILKARDNPCSRCSYLLRYNGHFYSINQPGSQYNLYWNNYNRI